VKATSPITVLSSKGRVGFTIARESTGIFIITFSQPHPDGKDYVLLATTEAYDDYIRSGSFAATANSFQIVIRNGTNFIDANLSFSVLA
jgi:hypothetical protein